MEPSSGQVLEEEIDDIYSEKGQSEPEEPEEPEELEEQRCGG